MKKSVQNILHPLFLVAATLHISALFLSIVRSKAIVGTCIWTLVSLAFLILLVHSLRSGTIAFYQGYGVDRSIQPKVFYCYWISSSVFWVILNGLFTYAYLTEIGYLKVPRVLTIRP